jgi:butyrate kinase
VQILKIIKILIKFEMKYRLLIINPGSTGIKISIFEDNKEKYFTKIVFDINKAQMLNQEELIKIESNLIKWIEENKISVSSFDAIISRAGLLKPVSSGVYEIDKDVIKDLKKSFMGWHSSNLGPIISDRIAKKNDLKAYLMDPITVDEMDPIAKITGIPGVERKSIFHALNHKAVARRACKDKGLRYEDLNMIVAHLGSGITVGAHKKGRVVDVNNGLNGEGPFSSERSNDIPNSDLIDICFSGNYDRSQVYKLISSSSGLYAYFKTRDISEIRKLERNGNEQANLLLLALAYQISKEISKNSAVLMGDIDSIILTGGMAYDKQLVNDISKRVKFLAPLWIYPGEEEMLALCEGGLSVLKKETVVKKYANSK